MTLALEISKAFDSVWNVGLLHKLKPLGISGQVFGLTSSFFINDGLQGFWIRSLHKNIQLMLEFLKGPFLVLRFSYYTLMTFLMMLFGILLYMLMILLSILSLISHLTCGNNLNWLLNLILIYVTLEWSKKCLVVDFNAQKT